MTSALRSLGGGLGSLWDLDCSFISLNCLQCRPLSGKPDVRKSQARVSNPRKITSPPMQSIIKQFKAPEPGSMFQALMTETGHVVGCPVRLRVPRLDQALIKSLTQALFTTLVEIRQAGSREGRQAGGRAGGRAGRRASWLLVGFPCPRPTGDLCLAPCRTEWEGGGQEGGQEQEKEERGMGERDPSAKPALIRQAGRLAGQQAGKLASIVRKRRILEVCKCHLNLTFHTGDEQQHLITLQFHN